MRPWGDAYPSLTPDSYNLTSNPHSSTEVVAPSLTPDSYNQLKTDGGAARCCVSVTPRPH